MSRKKSEINTVYQPIGTVALPPDLVELLHAAAKANPTGNGPGVAAVVREALRAYLMPKGVKKNEVVQIKSEPDLTDAEKLAFFSADSF